MDDPQNNTEKLPAVNEAQNQSNTRNTSHTVQPHNVTDALLLIPYIALASFL